MSAETIVVPKHVITIMLSMALFIGLSMMFMLILIYNMIRATESDLRESRQKSMKPAKSRVATWTAQSNL